MSRLALARTLPVLVLIAARVRTGRKHAPTKASV